MELSEADKKLIEEEEQRFRETIESLCEELPQVRDAKISANRMARELTRRVVNEWNPEERQPLVSDEAVAHQVFRIRKDSDRTLMELIQEPYFGRVVTLEDDGQEVAFLIGKKGNIPSGIVDWRNGPISSLYFNYRQGEEFFEVINDRERSGRIKIRRSYKVEAGQLVQIDSPEGVFHRRENGWERLDVEAEIAAHRSRGIGSREKKLPGILSLITREQFQMITTDPDQPVIIQGSAGSGKTTVALHRLAWLLHQENSPARPKNTRVLVMSKALQLYICSTLPSLGIDGVETTTFNHWALSMIRKAARGKAHFKFHNLPGFVEEIKFSEEILHVIAGTVEKQVEETGRIVRRALSENPGFLENWGKGCEKAILPRVRDLIHDIRSSGLREKEKHSILGLLNNQLEKLQDYIGDLYDLLSDEAHLRSYLKPSGKLGSHLQYLARLTARNRRNHALDYFDMSLILRIIQLKNGGLPGSNGERTLLDHLVIDEAQDFGPVEFAIMIDAVEDRRHMTIVGDVSQKILFSRKFIGWDKIIHCLELDEQDLIRLEISYRCTAPIMTLAKRVEGEPQDMEGRKGPPPVWHVARDKDDLLETITHWVQDLRKQDPFQLVAVLCRYPRQAMELKEDLRDMIPEGLRLGYRNQFSFEPGVIVTNVHQVKGLEFDAVCIVEPSESNYPHLRPESRNLLYVAITRAQDGLLLVGTEPFTAVLQN
ncbi:MAG: 3'-5' exonuclease [Nitrospinaceae bacterium]